VLRQPALLSRCGVSSNCELKGDNISTLGFLFGLMGVSLGTWGVFFGILCARRIGKLTKQLKEKGILEQDYTED